MSAALKSLYLRRMGLAVVGAAVLALAMPGPVVHAQDVNPAASGVPSDMTGGANAIDALDLEALLRLRGDPKNTYYIKGTSYSLDWSAASWGYPGAEAGGAAAGYPGSSGSSATAPPGSLVPFSRINGSVVAAHNSPKKGSLLFAFRPTVPFIDLNSAQPIIERLWVGLGGHHFVTQGSSGAFPVICRLRGGARPFRGSLRVSQNKSLVWSAPVVLDPGQESTVEVDVGGGSPDGIIGQGGEWRAALRSDELGQEIEGTVFHLGTTYAQAYLITPSLAGHNTTDEAICVVPDDALQGSVRSSSTVFPRLEALSPALLPENESGWDSAREVIVPADMEHLLSPAVRSALMSWTAAGGVLVVAPGSRFIRPGVVQRRVFSPATPLGAGRIVVSKSLANLDRQPDSRSLSRAMLPIPNPDFTGSGPSAPEPSITLPRWPVFLILGVLYAAILGPLSLWLMRRVRRIVQVWLVVPLTASILTVVILALSGTWTHALRTLNVSTETVIASGASDGMARTQLWYFTPDGGNVSFDTGDQGVQSLDLEVNSPSDSSDVGAVTDSVSGGRHTVQLRNLADYGMRRISLSGGIHLNGMLGIGWAPDGSGEVVNGTDKPLPPSRLTTPDFERAIPALAAGQRYHFRAAGWSRIALPAPAASTTDSGAASYKGAVSYPGAVDYPRSSAASHEAPGHSVHFNPGFPFQTAVRRWEIPDSPWGIVSADRSAAGVRHCAITVTAAQDYAWWNGSKSAPGRGPRTPQATRFSF